MTYHVMVIYENTAVVTHERDTAAEALRDADNALPAGIRPKAYEENHQDAHIFRRNTAADDLHKHKTLELTCPNGRQISVTKSKH